MKCISGLPAFCHNYSVNHPRRDAIICVGVENDLSLLIIPIIVAGSAPNISTPHYDGCFSQMGS